VADNLTVLNSTGGTFTLRMKDTTGSGGPLANMSVPTDTTGNQMSVLAGATVVSTAQGASVTVISSLSPSHLVTPSSNVTVALSSVASVTPSSIVSIAGTVTLSSAAQVTLTSATVTLSSNPTLAGGTVTTVTSITSGTVAVSNGTNLANVVAGSSAVTSTMSALVVALSTLGNFSVTTSSQIQITNGTNTANVLAGSSTVTSTMASLVVSLSSNGAGIIGTGTAGTAASQVLTIQGIASMTPVISQLSSLGFGGTTSSNSTPVVPADQYGGYISVAAGATQTALGSSAGRAGDYLAYVMVFPANAACGAVTVFDSTSTTLGTFAGGGTTALPSLVPFPIYIGAYSVSSGWKVSTGSSVTALGIGKFT
jgi:large repetitive protein